MIQCYEDLWPDHPFGFRIPYESDRGNFEQKFGRKVELKHVPPPANGSSHIRHTVLNLLEDLDEEMVYWALDDKYPVQIHRKFKKLTSWVQNRCPQGVDGISASRRCLSGDIVQKKAEKTKDIPLVRREDYAGIWIHQFLRVRALRELFSSFPNRPFSAKEMDGFKDSFTLPIDTRFYGSMYTYVVFGESTTRGHITRNCYDSMVQKGIPVPTGFGIKDIYYEIGSIHLKICGIPVPYWFITPVKRFFTSLEKTLRQRK